MKNHTIYRILPVSLILLLMVSVAMAQQTPTVEEKDKAAKEKEMKIKQEQLFKQQKELKDQQLKVLEFEKTYPDHITSSGWASNPGRVYSYSTGDDEGSYFIMSNRQENQSQLTLRNSFNGTSDTSIGEFDVDNSTTNIRCAINGKVRSGKITVEVLYPGGKVFKKLSITSSAEISFTQSLTIKQEEQNKYVGKWKYEVTADKAEGSYSLSIMTH